MNAECESCKALVRIAAETYRTSNVTRCVACGGTCRVDQTVIPGEVVLVSTLEDTKIVSRFDTVIFSTPGAEQLHMKRVWGLPGEEIRIHDGEFWIDGKLLQKNLAEFQELAVPISRFPSDAISHWFVEDSEFENRYRVEDLSHEFTLNVPAGKSLRWKYQKPVRLRPHTVHENRWMVASEIDDDYPCNQGLSYQLQPVNDFLLSIEFADRLTNPVDITCSYLGRRILVRAVSETVADRSVDRQREAMSEQAKPVVNDPGIISVRCKSSLTVAFCDHRILLRTELENHAVNWHAVSEGLPEARTGDCQIQIVGRAAGLSISRLLIARDLYLRTTHRDGGGEQEFGGVPNDSYFVLGDNLPASIDSRHSLGMVPQHRIRGLVLLP